jgi:hypothetical protein
MPTRLRTALLSAGAVAVAAVTVFGAATPAFAKIITQLSGPRVAHAGHAFRLTATLGIDGDSSVQPALVRLQERGARGRYTWYGPWHRMRSADLLDASYTFTLTERHRETVTFRAVLGGQYSSVTSPPVTIAVR